MVAVFIMFGADTSAYREEVNLPLILPEIAGIWRFQSGLNFYQSNARRLPRILTQILAVTLNARM
jgi:hypothetical protein